MQSNDLAVKDYLGQDVLSSYRSEIGSKAHSNLTKKSDKVEVKKVQELHKNIRDLNKRLYTQSVAERNQRMNTLEYQA